VLHRAVSCRFLPGDHIRLKSAESDRGTVGEQAMSYMFGNVDVCPCVSLALSFAMSLCYGLGHSFYSGSCGNMHPLAPSVR